MSYLDSSTEDNVFPPPPVLNDHLRPTTNQPNPSIIAQPTDDSDPIPLPPLLTQQPTPQHSTQFSRPQNPNQPHFQPPNPAQFQTMPINDPSKTTIAFDMYIPTQTNHQYQQNHPLNCDCCPHHHKRQEGNRILYRHLKQPTWWQSFKDKSYLTWEFLKQTYFHLEPWVFRPLLAGIAYNVGIQLARVAIQYLFPTYFPTTVYLPLRANAKFYDLHEKRIHAADQSPLRTPPPPQETVAEVKPTV